MTKTASKKIDETALALRKPDPRNAAFIVTGLTSLAIKAGTSLVFGGAEVSFGVDAPIDLHLPVAGRDYEIILNADGSLSAVESGWPDAVERPAFGGFHFAPGGNATARAGGDDVAQINPFSLWDRNFLPACGDARGMALVEDRRWVDIYMLGTDPEADGTSRFGVEIADGASPPKGYKKLDYETAKAVMAKYGKQLLAAEEFFAATDGVSERTSQENDPQRTGLDAARTSRWGIMQATGNLWVWGNDGHPDDPRASIFGGSWSSGEDAGSRYAILGYWPAVSHDYIGARGRSDHLVLA